MKGGRRLWTYCEFGSGRIGLVLGIRRCLLVDPGGFLFNENSFGREDPVDLFRICLPGEFYSS